MTTFDPRTPVTPAPAPAHSETFASPAGDRSRLALQVWRPTSTAVLVHVAGDLDASSAPRLHELLAPRLASTVETLVLDLSALEFLGWPVWSCWPMPAAARTAVP